MNTGMFYKKMSVIGIFSIISGLIIGAIDFVFGQILINITDFRYENYRYLIPLLPLAGVVIVYAYNNFAESAKPGMSLVFEAGNEDILGSDGEKNRYLPKILVPFIMIGTWITHLFGGSAGREGVSIQIGAVIASTFSKHMEKIIDYENLHSTMVVAGMAAGFAGLFQTPVAAVFFATECLTTGHLKLKSIFPAAIASFTASFTSAYLGLEKFSVNLNTDFAMTPVLFVKLVALGIIFALAGFAFSYSLKTLKEFLSDRIKNEFRRIFYTGIVLSVFLLLAKGGRYGGLGTNIISDCFNQGNVYGYDFILKLIFTVLTLSCGFLGGEVTPLFAIGASLGYIVAPYLGIDPVIGAALGYASVFASAANVLLAGIFIGAEVFGYSLIPMFFVCVVTAFSFNFAKSIYSKQRRAEHMVFGNKK